MAENSGIGGNRRGESLVNAPLEIAERPDPVDRKIVSDGIAEDMEGVAEVKDEKNQSPVRDFQEPSHDRGENQAGHDGEEG